MPRLSRACCSPPKHWSRRFLKRKRLLQCHRAAWAAWITKPKQYVNSNSRTRKGPAVLLLAKNSNVRSLRESDSHAGWEARAPDRQDVYVPLAIGASFAHYEAPMIRANCRARFTAADFDFIVRTLARSQTDQVSLVDLLSEIETRD